MFGLEHPVRTEAGTAEINCPLRAPLDAVPHSGGKKLKSPPTSVFRPRLPKARAHCKTRARWFGRPP